MPLKSTSFYGDSQINDFLGSEKGLNFKDSEIFSDKKYGHFVHSAKNGHLTDFFSVKKRHIFTYIYQLIIYYFSNLITLLNSKLFINYYFLFSMFYFKLDFILSLLKLHTNTFTGKFGNYIYFYEIKYFYIFFKKIVSIFNLILIFIIKIQSFLTISDFSYQNNLLNFISMFKNYLLFN